MVRRAAVLVPLLAAIQAFAPVPARARNDMGLAVDTVEVSGGVVTVSYRVDRPFTPRLEETLLQGMPATITFEVGVWKRRALWFDKAIVAMKSEHRVAYDAWRQVFRVRSGGVLGGRTRSVPTLDSLETILFHARGLPVATTSGLEPEASYYVSVRVHIRPVTEEDLGEIEDWLSGEVKDTEGQSRGLPRYLFGLTANLSGLGDRTAIARSAPFTPARRFAATGVGTGP